MLPTPLIINNNKTISLHSCSETWSQLTQVGCFCFFIFYLFNVQFEQLKQTLERIFHQDYKQLEVLMKYMLSSVWHVLLACLTKYKKICLTPTSELPLHFNIEIWRLSHRVKKKLLLMVNLLRVVFNSTHYKTFYGFLQTTIPSLLFFFSASSTVFLLIRINVSDLFLTPRPSCLKADQR